MAVGSKMVSVSLHWLQQREKLLDGPPLMPRSVLVHGDLQDDGLLLRALRLVFRPVISVPLEVDLFLDGGAFAGESTSRDAGARVLHHRHVRPWGVAVAAFETRGAALPFEDDWVDARRDVARDPSVATRAAADGVAAALNARVRNVGPRTF